MDLQDAFTRAIKSYFEDAEYDQLETMKGRKYNKKYFDDYAEELGLGSKKKDKTENGL